MKKRIILLVILIVSVLCLGIALYFNRVSIREYHNDNFSIKYDSTWKVIEKDNNLKLKHRQSNSIFEIQCKNLDSNYIDTSLKDIIDDVIDSVEKQNEGYVVISSSVLDIDEYEAYSYLYEKDMEQALVNIYKKDNKLIIVYYLANTKYYDIVLDSVDTMLDSLEINTGIDS